MRHRGTRRISSKRRKTRQHVEKAPRTAKQYFAMPPRFQRAWDQAVQVPGLMRTRGLSLRNASQEVGLRPHMVLSLVRSAFRKRPNGRYVAKRIDRHLRVLVIPSKRGLREIVVSDSRKASLVGEYWAALDRYLVRGDASGLEGFKRKRIRDANGKQIPLLTDLDELKIQASAGVLRFESLYGRVA
jgi:hypothetical protein